MDTAELRKIINDGYNKFRAFDEGKRALDQLDGLGQYEQDYQKRIELLKKEELKLLESVSDLATKNNAANEEIELKLTQGRQTASAMVDKANEQSKATLARALNDLSQIKAESEAKRKELEAMSEKRKELQEQLDGITFALDKAREKLALLME